ncbi:MAG TPA: response regulator transcription factor [Clostridia bacterium]|jgi:two-component system alkaline phosphatase synthesis response regulator PhoP|nr:response regulator transcription factor [Clostridia bacterium]
MENKQLIYAVDDEKSIRDLYDCALASSGFAVKCFENAETLFKAIEEQKPDMCLLDIMLDGMDGYEILFKLRAESETSNIPVILVSAKGEEISKVKGLNLGADDYIEKPFGIMELVARINANLRRVVTKTVSKIQYKDIFINDAAHEISIADNVVELTLKEYELLKHLVANAENVVTREDLLNTVWGPNYGETRTLDMHIASLRKALSDSETQINTIRGVGYLLK